MEITASLFGDMLPASLQQQPTQGYSPDYYQQMQQYYSGYLPGQSLDTTALQDWYGSESNIPYGGTTFAPRAQPTPVSQSSEPIGTDYSSGGGSDNTSFNGEMTTDLFEQLQNLNSPLSQGLLSFMPYGLGGALSGYQSADVANQINDIVSLYGGTLGDKTNPGLAALQGLFGMTPDSVKSAGALAGQFDNIGQFAGYMQAGTDPVLGSIVNNLADLAPEGLTPQQYGTIAQSVGDQINQTLASNPTMSYEDAAAVTGFNLGVSVGPTTAEQTPAAVDTISPPSYDSYSYSDPSESYGGGDTTSSSTADSTASDNSGVGGW